MTVKYSPTLAPDYSLYREGITAADVMTNVKKQHGCNAHMYRYAHIQVIPAAGVNPDVAVWWWSEQANKFIQEHTPITKAGVGAGLGYEFDIEAAGRIFYVQVTATTGAVAIMVAGFEHTQFL